MPDSQKRAAKSYLNETKSKWGSRTVELGYTILPNILIERQQSLGLSSLDVCIILNLLKHWWEESRRPFPSKTSIANCIGVTARTVQRRIERMEKDGFIRREQRRETGSGSKGSRSNVYHLDGLIQALQPYTLEAHEERRRRRKEDRDAPARKKPRSQIQLEVIEGGSR